MGVILLFPSLLQGGFREYSGGYSALPRLFVGKVAATSRAPEKPLAPSLGSPEGLWLQPWRFHIPLQAHPSPRNLPSSTSRKAWECTEKNLHFTVLQLFPDKIRIRKPIHLQECCSKSVHYLCPIHVIWAREMNNSIPSSRFVQKARAQPEQSGWSGMLREGSWIVCQDSSLGLSQDQWGAAESQSQSIPRESWTGLGWNGP